MIFDVLATRQPDDRAEARHLLHNPFAHELPDGIADRGPADAELSGEGRFGDDAPRPQRPVENPLLNVVVRLLPEG